MRGFEIRRLFHLVRLAHIDEEQRRLVRDELLAFFCGHSFFVQELGFRGKG